MVNKFFALQNWYNERGLTGALWPEPSQPNKPDQPKIAPNPVKAKRLVLFVGSSLTEQEKQLLQKVHSAAKRFIVVTSPAELLETDTIVSFTNLGGHKPAYQCCSLGQLVSDAEQKKMLWSFLKSCIH